MTGWSDIITSAMQIIDDARWRDELANSPAQFYRAKSQTLLFALPTMSRPPELLEALQNGMAAPSYDDFIYLSPEDTEEGEHITVNTGLVGFELMSVVLRSEDGMEISPVKVISYDAATGETTIEMPEAGEREYSFDAYTDGTFHDLTPSQIRLFSMAIAVVWDERFQRDYLANTMKINDQSFQPVNESNYMKVSTSRYTTNKAAFEDALRKYEQLCTYETVVRNRPKTRLI